MNFLRTHKIYLTVFLFLISTYFLTFAEFAQAENSSNFSEDKKDSDEKVDGSAQFMVEQMPIMPPPQLINTQSSVATPKIAKTTPAGKDNLKKWTGFVKKITTSPTEDKESKKDAGITQGVAPLAQGQSSTTQAKDQMINQGSGAQSNISTSTSITRTQTTSVVAKEKLLLNAESKEVLKKNLMTPIEVNGTTKTSLPVKSADQITPVASVGPVKDDLKTNVGSILPKVMGLETNFAKPTPTTIAPLTPKQQLNIFPKKDVQPYQKDSISQIEEKPLPTEPTIEQRDAVQAPLSLATLPQKQGVYMIAPLEAEMKLAAQQLDFERAIQIRNQIQQIKQIEGVSEIIELEQKMILAAQDLKFEEAIDYREQIRQLQLTISIQEEAPEVKEPEVVFQVKSFSIAGNQAFASEELLAYTSELTNVDITLTDVRNAARKIKQHYRDKGFIAAYVFIPKGALKDGNLELTIVEGKIGEVRIEGNKHFSDEVLTNYINYMKLMPGDTAMFQNVRNYLSQLNDHRDISAKATFQPGANSETTDLIVNVQDKNPFHVSMDYNNFGTVLSGQDRIGTTITHTNLLGNMDEFMFRTQLSESAEAFAVDYNTPIGLEDWRGGFGYNRGDVNLSGDFKALNAESNADTYSIYATKPLSYNADLKSNLRFGFDHKSSQSKLLGITTGKDELRILNFMLDVEQTDAYGKTYWPNAFHYGIDAFGASNKNEESLNRAHTGAPFFIYRSQLDRFLYLPNEALLQLHSAWQLTPDKLPSSEQFQLGGINTVRGYPQGEYVGDYGVVASAEMSFPIYGMTKSLKLPGEKASLYDTTRFVTFYDFGTSDLKGALPGERASKNISGAGLGLRMRLYEKINAQVEYAWPLADLPSDGSDGAWYYGLSMDVI